MTKEAARRALDEAAEEYLRQCGWIPAQDRSGKWCLPPVFGRVAYDLHDAARTQMGWDKHNHDPIASAQKREKRLAQKRSVPLPMKRGQVR